MIWGALFKILHLPGGNTLLCIGMGTEIAMFLLTAFDRPPKEYAWEDVFPVLDSKNPEDRPDFRGGGGGGGVFVNGGFSGEGGDAPADDGGVFVNGGFSGEGGNAPAGGGFGGGVIVAGGGFVGSQGSAPSLSPADVDMSGDPGAAAFAGGGIVTVADARAAAGIPQGVALSEEDTLSLRESIKKMADASEQLSQMAELTTATQDYLAQLAGIAEQMTQLKDTTRSLNEVSSVLLQSYRAITENSENITASSTGYVDKMEDLNRNIGGLNTIYEIQLKSISSQLESIDRVNRGLKDIRDMYEKSANESAHYCEETEKMARYMKQLNQVYEKMITAMTINMHNPMMGGMGAGAFPQKEEE